ncbi:DUF6318 family protein [Tersicoccus phoenicis]|uniref:DUF6318 family protein n=1 Tax=Tersicoccus phoenicis TaxID=554083 RepID=UPI00117F9D5B|nr:DUF6318 family protein [Tersicoccus phoenicis]
MTAAVLMTGTLALSGCTGEASATDTPGASGSSSVSGGASSGPGATPVVSGSPSASSPSAGSPSTSPTPSADPRPTAGSAKGPARNLPKPTMPAAAKQKTEAGLRAYAGYWVQALSYAYENNDTKPVRSVSNKECVDCISLYDSIDTNVPAGGWAAGGKLSNHLQLRDGFVPDINGQYVVIVRIDQAPYVTYTSSGKIASRSSGVNDLFFLLAIEYRGTSWSLINYDPVKS